MSRPFLFGLFPGLLLPTVAHAHGLSWQIFWLFAGAPIAAIVLSIVLGIVLRSWKHFLLGFGLVLLWVLWFWIAGQTTTLDIMFWIPMAAVHVQVAILAAWLIYLAVKRMRR